jgi:DNA-directed RNA polymerase specialized sigma24 family protein
MTNSFKSTPIPHRSKSGEPMAYYVVSEDGEQYTKATRAVCLARTEESDSPYPQRWFVDEESGMVVRLPRNAKGDELARDNMRDIWREDKRQERKASCIGEGSNRCPITCAQCPMDAICESKHKADGGLSCVKKCESCSYQQTRMVDLDMTYDGDNDESTPHFEPADEHDTESVVEEKALLDTLHAALATLTQEDADLIRSIFWDGKTERQLAPELGLKEPKSVNKRKHRALEILRNNEALRAFFK